MKATVAKYGVIYFALVFAAGFVLGTIRVLAVEPRIGSRYAELLEIPIMLYLVFLAARLVVSRIDLPAPGHALLAVGAIALALLIAAELTVVLGLRGISLAQYLESRDALAFGAYVVSLVVFAVMPWLVNTRMQSP